MKKSFIPIAVLAFFSLGFLVNLPRYFREGEAGDGAFAIVFILASIVAIIYLIKRIIRKRESETSAQEDGLKPEKPRESSEEVDYRAQDKVIVTTPPSPKKKASKNIVIGILVLVIILMIGFNLTNSDKDNAETTGGAGAAGVLTSLGDITEEQKQAIQSTFDACGIKEIESIEHDECLDDMNAEDEKGYRISANGMNNIIVYVLNGKVTLVRYADITFYENGTVIKSLDDYAITFNEQSDYYITSMDIVKAALKAPSTAEFPNITEASIWKEDGIVIVQSYVEAQNSFGAMLRSEYQIKYEGTTPTSFILDGIEYLE